MPIDALPVPPLGGADVPAGIVTKAIEFGGTKFDLTAGSGQVTVTAPKNIIHTPTGRQLFSGPIVERYVSGVATFPALVPNDTPNLSRYDWTYRCEIQVTGAVEQPAPFDFMISVNDPAVIDGDKLTPVPSSVGTPVSVDVDALIARVIDDPNSALYARIHALVATLTGFGQGNP